MKKLIFFLIIFIAGFILACTNNDSDDPVSVAVTGVSLDRSKAFITIAETDQLTAAVIPETATNKNVSWSSSQDTIASVDSNGEVTAIAAGKAAITVATRTENGSFRNTGRWGSS